MSKRTISHPYAEIKAFERLMLLIATFVKYPGVGSSDLLDEPSSEHHDALQEVLVRLHAVAKNCGVELPAYSVHTLRKDLGTLRRYGILERRMYRWGYYLGTGAMNRAELQVAINALQSQAKYQQDPQIGQIHQRLMRRLRGLDLADEFFYPVRTQIDQAIVYTNPEEMMSRSKYRGTLFEKLEDIELAIVRGQVIEIYRSRNPYQTGNAHHLTIWPLQLIYSDIAWYLLHEDCQSGHLALSRLDRFSEHFRLVDPEGRGLTAQRQSLLVANQLLDSGWGLYLGTTQEQKLERLGQLDFVTMTVRFFQKVMAFIQEGEKRHHSQKIREGAKDQDGRPAYVDYTVTLPPRSIKEFSLWIYRFMGNARVLSPEWLMEEHRKATEKQHTLYNETSSS